MELQAVRQESHERCPGFLKVTEQWLPAFETYPLACLIQKCPYPHFKISLLLPEIRDLGGGKGG